MDTIFTLAIGIDEIVPLILIGVAVVGSMIGGEAKKTKEQKEKREKLQQQRKENSPESDQQARVGFLDSLMSQQQDESPPQTNRQRAASSSIREDAMASSNDVVVDISPQSAAQVNAPSQTAMRVQRMLMQQGVGPTAAPPKVVNRPTVPPLPRAAQVNQQFVNKSQPSLALSKKGEQKSAPLFKGRNGVSSLSLRQALIMKEVLDQPLALRSDDSLDRRW
jgi:hypothetical protein